ncbi:MAG: HAD family hydrolase [Verrucomicrobiota bacterium]
MDLQLDSRIRPIDLVVFDCDGVLLDTMAAKIQAFKDWVPAEYAHHREEFMQIVMNGFGRSRSHHITSFYEEILGERPPPDLLEEEVERFTAICEPLCAAAKWRPGSKEFVKTCQKAGALRYVLSGTPQKPLEDMLESSGGTALFDVIIGSPPGKPESMERILSETEVSADRTLFIGDANADQVAALHVGAHFAYFPSEANPPEKAAPTTVNDLRELIPAGRE